MGAKIERKEEYEKVVFIVRHPETRIGDAIIKGEREDDWDEIEKTISLDGEGGHKMAKLYATHFKEVVEENEGLEHGVYTSPLKRARVLAKYATKHLNENDRQENIVSADFSEIPMDHTKGELEDMYDEVSKSGGNVMNVMEKWFTNDPERITTIFEQERERVVDGLETLKNNKNDVDFVYSHRLYTGFLLWLIENDVLEREITTDDLPGILDNSRQIAYTSESQIGLTDGKWEVIKKGDTSHLSKKKSLIKGTF